LAASGPLLPERLRISVTAAAVPRWVAAAMSFSSRATGWHVLDCALVATVLHADGGVFKRWGLPLRLVFILFLVLLFLL